MRRTKVAHIYKKTGNLKAVQLLLGHANMDSTVRYLGVELEDALAISDSVEIKKSGLPTLAAPSRPSLQPLSLQCDFFKPGRAEIAQDNHRQHNQQSNEASYRLNTV